MAAIDKKEAVPSSNNCSTLSLLLTKSVFEIEADTVPGLFFNKKIHSFQEKMHENYIT